MNNQSLIQVRVDSDLKDQAAEVYERIGIDIPTAIRMFLKASVKEQGLPFTPTMRDENEDSRYDIILARLGKIEEMLSTQPVPSVAPISEPIPDTNSIVVMPLEYGMDIPMSMYIQLISKVPCGCITCWRDINDFLGKLYGRSTQERSRKMYPPTDQDNNAIPYWRVVSDRGVLQGFQNISKEEQRERLTQEGLSVIQRGMIQDSFKVNNYKAYLYDFSLLRIIKK